MYGFAQSDLWWREKMPTGSHFEFAFLHKPIVYGVARLLYGVATSDSVSFVNCRSHRDLLQKYRRHMQGGHKGL